MKRIFTVLSLALMLNSCVSLESVSLTQIPKERKNIVSAESSRFMFLFINFDNDYVDRVTRELMDKCQGGKVQGILTKDYMTNYFLGIFTRRTVEAKGYCMKG